MARPGLRNHPKFLLLCQLAGDCAAHVYGHLGFLWETAYESGKAAVGTSRQVELAAGWDGQAGTFTRALLDCGEDGQAGFIEPIDGDSARYQIHDLYDHAPDYVKKRMLRETEREARGKTLSDLRAEAGKLGGSKRKQTADSCLGKQTEANGSKSSPLAPCQEANGDTPAPAPAPKEIHGRKRPVFVPPSEEDVRSYCSERHNGIDPEAFVDYYQTRGWNLGRGQPMKDWRAAVRTWEKHAKERDGKPKDTDYAP
jgi:hypothetical protein